MIHCIIDTAPAIKLSTEIFLITRRMKHMQIHSNTLKMMKNIPYMQIPKHTEEAETHMA